MSVQGNCLGSVKLKESYFWWFGILLVCGDSTGNNQIEKDQGCVSRGLVERKRGERAVWFSMCGAPLDDLLIFYVDVLFMCGECGFNSLL